SVLVTAPLLLVKQLPQLGGSVRNLSLLSWHMPNSANLLAGMDRVLACGDGYRFLVGMTRWGTQLLQENSEAPLPLTEMIPISSSRHVQIWLSMNLVNEPMDLLFCAYCVNDTKEGIPTPSSTNFA